MRLTEIFDLALERYLAAQQTPCLTCNGLGKVPSLLELGKGPFDCLELRGDRFVFTVQEVPAADCPICEGRGHHGPEVHHAAVTAPMLAEIIRYAAAARDHDRFDAMNAALDWALAYVNRCAEAWLADPTATEALLEMTQRFWGVEPPSAPDPTVPDGSALTDNELRDLGVLEDDAADGPRRVTVRAGVTREDLVPGKSYVVVCPAHNDPSGYVRIIDESGEDYLHPLGLFEEQTRSTD